MAANDDISFPFRGISDRSDYEDQPINAVPPGAMVNCRAFDVSEDRGRGGQRPGAWPIFMTQICGGMPIQALAVISKASQITGYVPTECERVTGWEGRDAGTLTGQFWLLGAAPSMFRSFNDARSGGGSTRLGTSIKWHPLITNDIRRYFTAALFVDAGVNGGSDYVGIACEDELGTSLWTANITDKQAGGALPGSPRKIFSNHIEVVAPELGEALVLVSVLATGAGLQEGFIYVFKASDGTYLRRYNIDGWASEVQQCVTMTDGKVAVLFWGSGSVNGGFDVCIHGTPILPGGFAQYFRSGIAKYELTGNAADPLHRINIQGTPTPGVDVENLSHGCWRFSEHLQRAPRGAYPTSIAAAPDGRLVVTFSNKGWGPNATYTPADDESFYSNVALIDSAGGLVWEVDTGSIRRAYVVGVTTYHNDIPGSGDPFGATPPSLFASACSSEGEIYVGGARNSADATATVGFNLFRLAIEDGRGIWRANVGGAASAFSGGVAQAGICIDPTDRNPVIAGYRSDAWDESGSVQAHLWKWSRESGRPLWGYDLLEGAASSAQSVDVDSRGRIAYATPYVT